MQQTEAELRFCSYFVTVYFRKISLSVMFEIYGSSNSVD